MEKTFYLLTTLIEKEESISDYHSLYEKIETAMNMFEIELTECAENFEEQKGDFLINLPMCREWRNEDGYGYTVTVEEIKPFND